MLTACHGADLTRWQDGQWVERSAVATGLAPGSVARSRFRGARKPWRSSSQGSTGSKERPASYQGEHWSRSAPPRSGSAGTRGQAGVTSRARPKKLGIISAMTESSAARAPTPTVKRDAKGKWLPGVSGHPGGDAARARKVLNAATIAEMHRAFREGGRAAILKVMKQQPAAFLKLLVLLVPRELEVTHGGGVKSMSDAELEAGIEMIRSTLAAREAAENAKVVEGVVEDLEVPTPETSDPPAPRARRKAIRNVGQNMGSDSDTPIS